MKIVDLNEDLKPLYFLCLEDWSEEMRRAGTSRKERWFSKMSREGLRVKLALDDTGVVGGMIQYLPIEHSLVDGKDMHFVNCIWIHGHREGRGNFQGRGMGTALLRAAEDDAKALGSKALVVWGISLPFWMRAKWFVRQGYKKVDKDGMRVLLWNRFDESASPPKWITQNKAPGSKLGSVTVVAFNSGWCQAQNLVADRAQRVSAEFGDAVEFSEIDTSERATFLEWGISDALFIDGKEIRTGPPPSAEKLRKMMGKRVKKLKSKR